MSMPAGPRRIWTSNEFRNVFYNQYVCIIGDSVQRAIYKDFVKLFQTDERLTPANLKAKGEESFMGDRLLRRSERMTNGKEYEEIRIFHQDTNVFKFFFLTKIYSDYVESVVFNDLKRCPPDILIINSCVWDITRYGPEAISEYKISLERFFTRVCHDHVLPETTEVIWLQALPLGQEIKGGFIVQTVQFMDVSRLRLDILEANRWIAENVAPFYDFNVLDLHYMLRELQHWRELDGIHWSGEAHRYITSAICEFVEYLNIRAKERSSKDGPTFSQGPIFAQSWMPPQSNPNPHPPPLLPAQPNSGGGPTRLRRVNAIRDSDYPYARERGMPNHGGPSSMAPGMHREYSMPSGLGPFSMTGDYEYRPPSGLSDHFSDTSRSFADFHDRSFTSSFWSTNDYSRRY